MLASINGDVNKKYLGFNLVFYKLNPRFLDNFASLH